jgi:hypothetical protein
MEAPVSYSFPHNVPEKLDLRQPPPTPAKARNYPELVRLAEELGRALEDGDVERGWLLDWERRVLAQISDGEIDMFMAAPEAPEFTLDEVPQQRWLNLRRILMSRKGLRV